MRRPARVVERCPRCRAPRAIVQRAHGCGCVLTLCDCAGFGAARGVRLFADGGCEGCVVQAVAVTTQRRLAR